MPFKRTPYLHQRQICIVLFCRDVLMSFHINLNANLDELIQLK